MANNFKFSVEIEIPPEATAVLKNAAEKALHEVAGILDGRFTNAMNSSAWVWPRQSKRGVSGSTLSEVAKAWRKKPFNTGSPRDINDSGNLIASMDYQKAGNKVSWIWSADYAAAVHDGAWVYPWQNEKASKVLLPARPWTEAVLFGHPHYSGEVFDFSSALSRAVQKFAS